MPCCSFSSFDSQKCTLTVKPVKIYKYISLLHCYYHSPHGCQGWMQKRLHKEVWRRKVRKGLFFFHADKFYCLHLHMKRCRIMNDLCKPLYRAKQGTDLLTHTYMTKWASYSIRHLLRDLPRFNNILCMYNLTFLSNLWQNINKIEAADRAE